MRRLVPLALLALITGAVPWIAACETTGPGTLSNGQTLPPDQSGEPPGVHDAGPDAD